MYRGLGIDREALLKIQTDYIISSTVNRGVLGRKSLLGREKGGGRRMAKDRYDSSINII